MHTRVETYMSNNIPGHKLTAITLNNAKQQTYHLNISLSTALLVLRFSTF